MVDSTGIELEEMASELELETLTLPITWLTDSSDKELLITGVALTEGVWKNVIYSAAELEKYAPTLKGKPVLVEHGRTKEFEEREVGKVIDAYFEPTLKGIVFKAKIFDPLAKRLVKKDVLSAVSCSTWMEKKPINETIRLGKKFQFSELSLVREPACDRCFIFHKEQLSSLIEGKDLKENKAKKRVRGDLVMETKEMENEEEFLSEVEEEEEELMEIEELEEPKLYAVLELPDEDSLESLRKVKKVVSYYYGPPYYVPYYPFYGYPYYRYPYGLPEAFKYPYRYPYRYGYPKRKKKKLSEEEPVLLAVLELSNKEELHELRKTYRVRRYYYGYYGYPYPYGYYPAPYYPYKYKYKYLYPKKLSAEELSVFERIVGKALPTETPKAVVPETKIATTPNPESCAKIVCPIDDQEFKDEESFMEHWNKEHKEKYGDFKANMTILDALNSIVDLAKGDTKIVKTKGGRFTVFVDTGKEGFGRWKIVGNFATEEEAREAAKKAKLQKYPAPGYEGAFICPVDKKVFRTEKELADHWKEEHFEKYGPLKKGYLEPEKKAKPYYYYKYKGRYYPYYYRKGKYYRRYKAPKKRKK